MLKLFQLTTLLVLPIISCQSSNRDLESLRHKIEQIVSDKNAVVGLAITGNNGKDTLSMNGDRPFPMQSVFKYHIALAVLSEVDKGRLSLDQIIEIKKNELLPGLWSPIREKYPDGAKLSIAELLKYTVSQSDNIGCDVLIRLLGEPLSIEKYIKSKGIEEISIEINEEVMQNNWDLQFDNWTTPKAANQALETFYLNHNHLLSQSSHDFVWKVMTETSTGANRLKGKLPEGTPVAHKTGWSGTNQETGITAAVNDIGIVFLPNDEYIMISVFVSESKESLDTNEEMIADIAKEAYDFYMEKKE